MRFHHPKKLFAIVLISLCPLIATAEDANTDATNSNVPTMSALPASTDSSAENTAPSATGAPATNAPAPAPAPAGNPSPANTTPAATGAPAVNTNPSPTETPPQANKEAESFENICLSSWMKRLTDVKDQVSYKNFGQKYCACALTQPLDTDAAVDKAIQTCMTRILLQDSMDSLEDKVGLDKASDKDINQSCQDKWALIYPQMSEQAKLNTAAFCSCAQPKLAELVKQTDKTTDKEYYAQIDKIAASCADLVKPNQQPKS